MRELLSVVVVLCGALAAGLTSAVAAPVEASRSKIVRVTVYPDRAEVVREAQVQVPAGASEVLFPGLPWQLEADSLRASGKGVAATLGAVELKTEGREPAVSPEYESADRDVRRIEQEIASLDAQEGVARELGEFLRALRASAAAATAERLGELKADPASVQAVYALLRTGLEDLSKGALERQLKRQELNQALGVARAKREAARPKGPVRARTVAVEVDAKQAGSLTLSLAYVVPGASWRPAYRATLDADNAEVLFGAEGVVQQTTGEDWSGVTLSLSTAAPASGVEPPELSSWLLRPVEPQPLAKGSRDESQRVYGAAGAGPVLAGPGPVLAGPQEVAMSDVQAESSVIAVAAVVHSAYNVSFEVPGRAEVPADGREHRVTLRWDTLPAELAYRVVPAAEEAVYLTATSKAPAAYPLLGGPVRVFAGPAFLGSYGIEEAGPGEELTLPFGRDNRVKVARVTLPEARSREGFVGRDRQVVRAFRTTVENLRDRPVSVVLADRIPVSEDERIVVKLLDETTAGPRPDPETPGVLEWTFDLAPKEKREITLAYSVRFPRELVVPGL